MLSLHRRLLRAARQTADTVPPGGDHRDSIPSATVAAKLERGEPVEYEGVTLRGDLVLKPGLIVSAPFRCRACHIEGDVIADDVSFRGTVDLSGTTIHGAVSLSRARFDGTVLFDLVDEHPANFTRTATFNHASFGEGASFTGAVFSAPARFASARFLDEASFADACFADDALFADAAFDAATSFRRGLFRGTADFTRADFRGLADLSRTDISSTADFGETRFADRSTFFTAIFRGEAKFDDAVATGPLDLTNANFLDKASFLAFESTGLMTLDGEQLRADLDVNDQTSIDAVRVIGFKGVVSALDRHGDLDSMEHFLSVIESAAKERGDLKLANDARFERRKIIGEQFDPTLRIADYIFYRGIAGYFVRPWHPLVTLVLLAFLVALVRRVRTERLLGRLQGRQLPRQLRPVRTGAHAVLGIGRDTLGRLGLILPGSPGSGASNTDAGPRLIRVETWAYRLLLVVLGISLANSNPTLRQMLDALF